MNIKANTTTIYTIELSDADVGEILADPSAFQAELRMRRNALASTGINARRSIKLGKARRSPQERSDPKAPMRPSASGKIACAICGKSLTARGVTRHMRQSHPDAASAATA